MAGAMADACQEERWLSERLGGGKGLVSGGGQLVLTLSYAPLGRGGVAYSGGGGGGGKKGSRRKL